MVRATYPEVVADRISGRSLKLPNCFGRAALVDASLFGLAPRGVCLAAPVTRRAGALLH